MQVLGIDIGGSGIKGAVVDTDTGELLSERIRLETPQPATPEAVSQVIKEIILQLNWKGQVGCGFPSVIKNGYTITAANVDPLWVNTNAEDLFSKETGLKVRVINDADAAGLAEMKFGIGKDKKGVVLLLTIGTGIGSALFLNGALIPNTEFGHLFFKDMIAEKYCSDSARKRNNWEWDEWAKRFNHFLKHLERTFNPDLFIIGGGVSKKKEKFLEHIFIDTPVKIALLENNAGIIGAALGEEEEEILPQIGILDKVKSIFKS